MEQERMKCMFCGGDLCWDSDCDANEIKSHYSEDDTAVVSYYHCTNCGRSYEVCEPDKWEREEDYKNYWKV